MLRDARFLAFADVRHMLRRRETWLWTMVLPIVFFYFIGTITAHFGEPEGADQLAMLIPPDAGFLAGNLAQQLEKLGYHVVRSPDAAVLNSYDRRLVVPGGFTESVLHQKPVKLEFTGPSSGIVGDYDHVRLMRAAYTLTGSVAILSKDGNTPDSAAFVRLNATSRRLRLDIQPAGKRKQIPSGFEQSVPGSMVFFLLIVLLATSGVALVVERELGILRRLASSPISRGGVVLGKWGGRMSLAAIQIAFCMIAGTLLFGVHWGPHILAVLLVLMAYASLAAAAGLLIGASSRTRAQAGAIGSITANVLACIGGCWWPAEIMPRWMQAVSRLTPAGIAMDGLHKLVNFGAGPEAVWPHVVALGAAAIVAGFFAARSFRFQ